MDARSDIESIRVWLSILQVAVTFGGMKGSLYPILFSWSEVFHSTCDPWNQLSWEKEISITHMPPIFVICSNSHTRILDRCSPSYASMTLQVIEGIWYDISWNPTQTISSMKVSITSNISHMLCVYDLATSFNRRPVSWAATVLASYWALCLNIIILHSIHPPVKDRYWSNHPISSRWSLCKHTAS